jgi:hypothetical protein
MFGEQDAQTWPKKRRKLPIYEWGIVMAMKNVHTMISSDSRQLITERGVKACAPRECIDRHSMRRQFICPFAGIIKAADAHINFARQSPRDFDDKTFSAARVEAEHNLHHAKSPQGRHR